MSATAIKWTREQPGLWRSADGAYTIPRVTRNGDVRYEVAHHGVAYSRNHTLARAQHDASDHNTGCNCSRIAREVQA